MAGYGEWTVRWQAQAAVSLCLQPLSGLENKHTKINQSVKQTEASIRVRRINVIGQINEIDLVPITQCVRHHHWLNMIHDMTRLAQFVNKCQYTACYWDSVNLSDLYYCIYSPRIKAKK